MTYTFNNRETYLEFRAQWKADYRELSTEIRELKEAIKTSQRAGESRACVLQSERERLRAQARNMLITLAEAKIESQKQYEASLASA